MNADNWAECPWCVELSRVKYQEDQQKIKDAYGKIPADEYLDMVECSVPIGPETNENLREDYEIGIYKGRFCVSYKARCDRCGFNHSFTHEEQIEGGQ